MKLFDKKKNKAVALALHNVRAAFVEAMQEVRADIIANSSENDIPKVRDEFKIFSRSVATAVKSFDIHNTNQITAGKKGSAADLIALAVDTHKKGHEKEALDLFAYAASNSQDLHMQHFPNNQIVQNTCPACGSPLPIVANFCPICGTKLQAQQEFPNAVPPNPESVPPAAPMVVPSLPPMLQTSVGVLMKAGKTKEAAALILKTMD